MIAMESIAQELNGPYVVPRHPAPASLRLDSNEGQAPSKELVIRALTGALDDLNQYPDCTQLEASLAAEFGVAPNQVLLTAGADDAIQRVCRAWLEPGRTLVLPTPTFEMIERCGRATGASVVRIPWANFEYPADEVIARIDDRTGVVAMVSPNNPTGGVASVQDLLAVSKATENGIVMVDCAYAEFAAVDLTRAALKLPNTLVLRTFSKAFGLAGLRVGFVLGPATLIASLKRTGLPYPVSGPSIALATALRADLDTTQYVERVRRQREELAELVTGLGMQAYRSEGNFVFVRTSRAIFWRDAMAGLGIRVRAWPGHPELGDALRISVPGEPRQFERLRNAFEVIARPEAILFDMDGVLADVSQSYREAILATVRYFGGQTTAADIEDIKRAGDANNDWIVTQRLLAQSGIQVALADVTAVFNEYYQGTDGQPGFRLSERLVGSVEALWTLSERVPLGIVTGRPRPEAEQFLKEQGLESVFKVVVAMEDAPAKPSPEPVELALKSLGAQSAWMLGDTRDDIESARAAGVLPVGIAAPGQGFEGFAEHILPVGAAFAWRQWTNILEYIDE